MLLLLFQSAALTNYSLAAESGTLTLTGQDATLTATQRSVPTGGSVLAKGGRRRATSRGSQHVTHTARSDAFTTRWVQVEELTPEERAAKDAALEARLAEEARQRAADAAERAEAKRLANLRHLTLHATSADLRITKKRSHKLSANRTLQAGERFVLVRPVAAKLTCTHRFSAAGGALDLTGGNVDMIHRSVAENLALTQDQLRRLKQENEAMTLLLLAA